MAFCKKCGRELREEDEFCFYCKEPVRDIGAKRAGARIAEEHRKKKLRTARKAGLALIAILMVGFGIWSIVSGGLKDHTQYETYSNDKVCFSVEYPRQYSLTEQKKSKVLIKDGKKADFQVEIQYAYRAPSKAILYSAEDFTQLASWDSGMLTKWLGLENEDVQVTDFKEGTLGGKPCYEYDFKVKIGDKTHEGKLCIADGDGEFGCYSFMSLLNKDAENADLLKAQRDAMEKSFKVTKAYQPKGYKRYYYEKLGMQFVVKGDVEAKNEQSMASVVVYPKEDAYTKASIWIQQSEIKGLIDVRAQLQTDCKYYFSQKKKTKYLSKPAEKNWGRYSATGAELEFYDKGEHFTVSEFVFSDGGLYTTVTMKSTDEYLELASSAASDVLHSLKLGGDAAADSPEKEKAQSLSAAADIIDTIERQPEYAEASSWKPLAMAGDFNGDGTQEFLAVYEAKHGSEHNIMYEVWSLKEPEPVKLKSEVLFKKASKNKGIVGITESDGKRYLTIFRYVTAGKNFRNDYRYIPWEKSKSSLKDYDVYMEERGTSDGEGQSQYRIGDTAADKDIFDARYKKMTNWVYKLDLEEGPGKDGVMTFEDVKKEK